MMYFRQFSKSYDGRTIIAVPDETIEARCVWLRGQNGAGKSTLLYAIAGIIPFKGEILLDGISAKKNRMVYRNAVGFAPAEPQYPDFLTGNDLLRFYTDAKCASAAQLPALCEQMGVAAYAAQKTGTYSSGMLKKLSLVLAFAGKPKCILLDEPYITLDVASQELLTSLIQAALQDNVQIIITSHQALSFPSGFEPVLMEVSAGRLIKNEPA